jgi:hypothetical protein
MKQRKVSSAPLSDPLLLTSYHNQLDLKSFDSIDENRLETSSVSVVPIRSVATAKQQTISILNTGCDWSLVAQGWQVVRDVDEVFHCQGAFFTGTAEVSC